MAITCCQTNNLNYCGSEMRVSDVLFRFSRMPNGSLFIGKHRLVKEVKPFHKNRLLEDYRTEERNMLLLRHPYLAPEETDGYAKALGLREKRLARLKELYKTPFKSHVKLEDRLNHLNVSYAWE